jgi:hypothetical protein
MRVATSGPEELAGLSAVQIATVGLVPVAFQAASRGGVHTTTEISGLGFP